jgi:undecaprenyl-diphosphatase
MLKLKSKYPGIYAFLRNRFDPNEFLGLPLTILLFLVSVNLAMLSELSEHAINSPGVKQVDMEVTAWFFNLRTPFLSLLVYLFTQLGSGYGVLFSTVLLSLLLLWKKRPYYLLPLLVSVLGSALSMRLTKLYFQRERPLNFAYYTPEATYSFPSGHASSAMALMGIGLYFLLLEIKDNRIRWAVFLLGTLYILLMGISRIYLGVHFLTDVVAGFLLGLLWVILAIGLMEYSTLKKLKRKKTFLENS